MLTVLKEKKANGDAAAVAEVKAADAQEDEARSKLDSRKDGRSR